MLLKLRQWHWGNPYNLFIGDKSIEIQPTLKILGVTLWSSIGVKIKVSFYYAVLLFYVVVYAFTHAAFALFVAHFSIKDVNISFYSACKPFNDSFYDGFI